jgi:hypothetical protein
VGATKFLHLQQVTNNLIQRIRHVLSLQKLPGGWQCAPTIADFLVSPAVPLTSLEGIFHEQARQLIHADPVRLTFGSLLAWELEALVARVVPEL